MAQTAHGLGEVVSILHVFYQELLLKHLLLVELIMSQHSQRQSQSDATAASGYVATVTVLASGSMGLYQQ